MRQWMPCLWITEFSILIGQMLLINFLEQNLWLWFTSQVHINVLIRIHYCFYSNNIPKDIGLIINSFYVFKKKKNV